MKCPKCGYLGFDDGDRCKHCGYEFSLISRGVAGPGASDSHALGAARYSKARGGTTTAAADRRLSPLPEGTPLDLPLFGDGPVPPPRPPLSVRRATPPTPRTRVRSEGPKPIPLELDLGEPPASDRPELPYSEPPPEPDPPAGERRDVEAAIPARRFGAAAIDLLLLAAIDAVVLAFTLRLCGLAPAEIGVLPRTPLLAFFVLLDVGYLILFTGTIGQTLGKMALGIRVIPVLDEAMSLRRALWRTLAMVLSIGPAGLGYVPAAFGQARALHDRLAGTRVIQRATVS